MRIKLRLYTKDLDLLTLKQLPGFYLGAAIRQAIFEYAENGKCTKIQVPVTKTIPVVIKNDTLDISLENQRYEKTVNWLKSLRPGMRSAAIKTVFRSAVETPVLFAFECNSDIIIHNEEAKPATANGDTQKVTAPAPKKQQKPKEEKVVQSNRPNQIEQKSEYNPQNEIEDFDSLFDDIHAGNL